MFKAEVQLAGRMRWALNVGLKLPADELNMTPMNLFVKGNQQAFGWQSIRSEDEALDGMSSGRLVVDYAALQISAGPEAPVALTEAAVDADNILNVKFEKNPLRRTCNGFDNVYLWIYSEELQQGYLGNPVYRRSQRASVALPDEFQGTTLHVYAFAQDDQGRCSETAYMGLDPSSSALSADSGLPESSDMTELVDPETGEILPSLSVGSPEGMAVGNPSDPVPL